ncbi:MAG TPA: HAMP domain-containing sensor histidine kinase [Polyangiaceae bacterium]|nr:HAMP domain-containing sensor histidine kinase [Polyangiaceae bacterium]
MVGSRPSTLPIGPGLLLLIFLVMAYAPPLRPIVQFQNLGAVCALLGIGMLLTVVAYQHRCRGPVGSVATLLDNTFYSASMALAAMSTSHDAGLGLAAVHGVMLVALPGQYYGFSLLFAAVMCVPVAALLVVLQPALSIVIVTICSLILLLVCMEGTRVRRLASLRQQRLEQALGAVDRLADESIQTALTTTLLSLGHFLHELRNYQTAISLSLEYVSAKAKLDEVTSAALAEAQSAQRRQEQLLNDVVADLRGRSRPAEAHFALAQTVNSALGEWNNLDVVVNGGSVDFEIAGNPEHLRIVLLNLLRNAEQAGARTVSIVWRADSSGEAVQMIVHDDGHGIAEEKRAGLFETFALSDKKGGTGLGLYLVRRYVEVLGGQVRIEVGPMGGAAFVIRLPGRPLADAAGQPDGPVLIPTPLPSLHDRE